MLGFFWFVSEDEQVDLEPGKKNRSRGDMLNRNKRRRGGSNREEGEEASSEVESVDNDEEEDCEVDDDAGLANRKLSPTTATSSSSPSNLSHRRNSLPARLSKQSPTSLKVSDEMIGAPVPRKARSGELTWPLRSVFKSLIESLVLIGLTVFCVFWQLLQNGRYMIMGLPAVVELEMSRVIGKGQIPRQD